MKKGSTIFLQVVIVLIGIAVLSLMLWEPHLEGRNADATVFAIYFKDPFLAYAYIGSISFFVALVQAFKLLGLIGENRVFSQPAVDALRTIKRCALALVAFLAGAEAYFVLWVRGEPGGIMMGLVLIFVSTIIATAAAVFEKTLQSALDIKSENDLTV